MWLLTSDDTGQYVLTKNFVNDVPPFAILSHTWGLDTDEVTFRDVVEGRGKGKPGYEKLRFCSEQAKRDDLAYFWIDTCCIDKSNSTELAEAINSMFRWYQSAAKCYVYLSDVWKPVNDNVGRSKFHSKPVKPLLATPMEPYETVESLLWKAQFRKSRWFTRGWTLQELIAPQTVDFFSKSCFHLGDRRSLELEIHDITGIALEALRRERLLQEFSFDERMSWAKHRQTTRQEDAAYCLLGIFDVHMPLIYGEGARKALFRLRKEFLEREDAPSVSSEDRPQQRVNGLGEKENSMSELQDQSSALRKYRERPRGSRVSTRYSYDHSIVVKFLHEAPKPSGYSDNASYQEHASKYAKMFIQKHLTPLREERRALEAQVEDDQKTINALEDTQKMLELNIAGNEDIIKRRDEEHGLRIFEMAKRHALDIAHSVERAISNETDSHRANLLALREEHDTEVSSTESGHRQREQKLHSELEKVRQQERASLKMMASRHAEYIRDLQKTHLGERQKSEEKAAKLEDSLTATRKAASTEKEKMRTDHQASMQSLIVEHAKELVELRHQREYQEAALISMHEREWRHVRTQVRELNEALVANDELYTAELFGKSSLPRMSDENIYGRLAEISAIVNELGRLEWRSVPSSWSEQDFLRIQRQHPPRVVKTAIIQDVIWCSLFTSVFASPFRMFGQSGHALEEEWAKHAGNGEEVQEVDQGAFVWPPPSLRTERWRYMTLLSCREALTQPVSELDARAKIKIGFISVREQVTKRLEASIQDVAVIDAAWLGKIEKLTRRAQSMWLDFQMHRCRIVISLTGFGIMTPAERMAEIRKGSLKLTVLPELRRYGTVKGDDLHIITTIGGCEGETLQLS